MIEAPLFATNGSRHKGGFALPADMFDGAVNEPVLHQAVKVFLANQRHGTHGTKTRGFVIGGGRKPWRQKGTGRARQGTIRAPQWRGGGTVFGPHPRDYRLGMPKKVRQLARRSALNARAREGSLLVIDRVDLEEPKTARLAALLESIGLEGEKVLVLTHGAKRQVYLSGRNLPTVRVLPYTEAAAYDILWANSVLIEGEALGASADVVEAAAEAPKPRPRKRAAPKAKASTRSATKAKPKAKTKASTRAAAKPKAKAATKPKAASAKSTVKRAAKTTRKAAGSSKKKGSE